MSHLARLLPFFDATCGIAETLARAQRSPQHRSGSALGLLQRMVRVSVTPDDTAQLLWVCPYTYLWRVMALTHPLNWVPE